MMLRWTAVPLVIMAWGWFFVVQVSEAAGLNSSRGAAVLAAVAFSGFAVYALSYWRSVRLMRRITQIRFELKSAGKQITSCASPTGEASVAATKAQFP